MDNLVLTRIAVDLAGVAAGTELLELRQESDRRFRLGFDTAGVTSHLVASLGPELPWLGRPVRRWPGPRWSPDGFAVAAARALEGRRVLSVSKTSADRAVRFDLGDGRGLAIELATHGANLVLLGPGGVVERALHHPKGARERLAPGRTWTPRDLPKGKLDPFAASAEQIDAFLASRARDGEPAFEALRRDVFGVGSAAATLVLEEAAASGRTPGTVLRERLDHILAGLAEVVIEGPEDPLQAMDGGAFDPTQFRLLPWRPLKPVAGAVYVSRHDVLGTSGLFHEALEGALRVRERIAALGGILRGELRRTREAEAKVREGLRSFEDPERHRRMGEALLAGLGTARREAEIVFVPDPYDDTGRPIAVPAPPGRSLSSVADDLFQRYRRARRGLEAARDRGEALGSRGARLEALLAQQDRAAREDEALALEAAMRAEKIAVGFTRPTRAARAAAGLSAPKLEGVRIVTSSDGWTILVGRTARDNDRLTFKFAAPEDIWMHAQGGPGAHVVIRNPDRKKEIPEATLAEGARLAAWFSDARSQGSVDVQWTHRKNVRRARGGTSGMVAVKRFQTLRVRPRPPADGDQDAL